MKTGLIQSGRRYPGLRDLVCGLTIQVFVGFVTWQSAVALAAHVPANDEWWRLWAFQFLLAFSSVIVFPCLWIGRIIAREDDPGLRLFGRGVQLLGPGLIVALVVFGPRSTFHD